MPLTKTQQELVVAKLLYPKKPKQERATLFCRTAGGARCSPGPGRTTRPLYQWLAKLPALLELRLRDLVTFNVWHC